MTQAEPRTVLVAGASGLIGTVLLSALTASGRSVLRLVRRAPTAPDEIAWRPGNHAIDPSVMDRADAVVNLSGASLSRLPWTAAYRTELVASRLNATRTLTDAIARAAVPPTVFVSASAVGFYGNRPGETLTEDAARGSGFLSDLVVGWEDAARGAPEGVRVVSARTGLVIASGGALTALIPLARVGLAGRLGSGNQHWPWISLRDEVRALIHVIDSGIAGPVNLVGPTAATEHTVAAALAARVGRPVGPPVPSWLIGAALRDAGRELLLADQRVVPDRLTADGFAFEHTTIADAIAAAIPGGRRSRRAGEPNRLA